MEKQGGIYARYSPGRDRDQTSTIEAQVAMCREKAGRDGVAIDADHIYVDRGISGASVARAGFQAMLAAIEAGNFPEILYAKDDKRLFRNEREAGRLIEWIWEQDIEIRHCLMDFGDPRENDEQWFMQRQFHIIAELERRRKRTEVFEHQRQNALAGYSNGGLPPYGYRRKEVVTKEKKKKLTWEVDPKEVEAVKLAYEMQLQGIGAKSIADALTKQGFRSRRGGPMNKQSIAEWFRNPYPHAGCVVWNTRSGKINRKPDAEWIIVEGAYPGIISMEVADQTYQKAEARRLGKVPKKKGVYLLSGMMRCSECGASMILNSSRKRNEGFYVCGSRQRRKGCSNKLMLHQRAVEGQVIEWIKGTLLDTTFLKDYFQRVIDASNALLKDSQSNVERLRQKIVSLDHQIDRLTDAFADGTIPADIVKPKIEQALAEKREVQSEIRRYARPLPKLPDIATFQTELLHALDAPEMQKAAVSGLIEKIVVHPTAALDIHCSFQTCFPVDSPVRTEPRFPLR